MMTRQYIPYRLGIDLGTNSIGFALVELRNDLPFRPLHMGVRIFSDGRDPQKGTSLAVDRRTARGMRRRRDRFVRRQQQVMELLIEKGLMPQDKTARKELARLDPYELRQKGLDAELTPYELGRALFHLNQRRGFLSNRKQAAKDKEESGKVKGGIEKLKAEMAAHGFRTVGEFLASLPPQASKRVRPHAVEPDKKKAKREESEEDIKKEAKTPYDFYPQRDMLKHEYDLLLETQAKHHPALLRPEIVAELKGTIFHQRDLCPVERGKCSALGKGYLRAYSALPSSQYFRLLKEINNMKVGDRFIRKNWPYLSDEQRQKALEYLSSRSDAKFTELAKKVGLKESESFNLESDVRKTIYGLDTAHRLSNKKCFGAAWPSDLKEQDKIVSVLLEKNEDEAEGWIREHYLTLSEDQYENIMTASAMLEDGTLRYSTEAIEQLIEKLESQSEKEPGRFKDEYEAVTDCGWPYANHYTGEIMMGELPYYGELLERKTQAVKYGSAEEKEHGRIANPTVHVAMNQLRKMMNAVIADYGHPKEIAIEFSRELKLTKKEKEKRNKENKKNQDSNKRYDDNAREKGFTPSHDTRLRQKLWEQQDECCAYSGKKLSLSEALSHECEIDHILPFSQTFDDSNANKVLALCELNRHKGNRDPWQAFKIDRHPKVNWDELLLRVENTIPNKRSRFEEDALEKFKEARKSGDAGWLARQMTDTSYMARVAREYLRYVVGDRVKGFPAVDTYPGGITAKLRRGWGLNSLLPADPDGAEKNRTDHRHHAIDALVIACTNRSLLQQISRASATGEELGKEWYDNLAQNVPPYSQFSRTDIQAMVDKIIISHKPDHKTPGTGGSGSTSGKLHEETYYGVAKNQDDLDEGRIRLRVRVAMKDLRARDVVDICDPNIRRDLAFALEDVDDKDAPAAIAKFAAKRNLRRVRIFVEKSRKAMTSFKDKEGKTYRYAATGGNDHIDIFCPILNYSSPEYLEAKKTKSGKPPKSEYEAGKWYAETISTFDANQKDFVPQWRKDHPTAKLVMRLHINDMVAYEENGKKEIRRVKKNVDDRTYLVPHLVAVEKADQLSWAASANKLQEKNARKIAVTPAGKVYDPGKAPMPKPLRQQKA